MSRAGKRRKTTGGKDKIDAGQGDKQDPGGTPGPYYIYPFFVFVWLRF